VSRQWQSLALQGTRRAAERIVGRRATIPCHSHSPRGGRRPREGATVNLTVSIAPLIALIAGILILIVPRLLNYIVAIYLILVGLLGLFGGRLLA
jgi:hypothetical protein